MGAEQYEIQVRTSRVVLVLAWATVAIGVVGGGVLAYDLLGGWTGRSVLTLLYTAPLFLFGVGVLAVRIRSQAYALSLGRAGVYARTLLGQRFVPWADVQAVRTSGRMLVLTFRAAWRTDHVRAPFADDRQLARARAFAERCAGGAHRPAPSSAVAPSATA